MFYFQPVLVECVCKNLLTMEQIWMKRKQFSPLKINLPSFIDFWNTAFLQAVVSKGNSKSMILVIKLDDLIFLGFLERRLRNTSSWREKIRRSCSELSSRRCYLFQRLWGGSRKANFLIQTLQFQACKLCERIPFKRASYSGVTTTIVGALPWNLKLFTKHLGTFSRPPVFPVLSYEHDVFRGSLKYRNRYNHKK